MPDENQSPAGAEAEDKNIDTSTDKSTDGGQEKKGEQDKSLPEKKEEKKEVDGEKVEISKKDLNHYNQLKRKAMKSKTKKSKSDSKKSSNGMFTHQEPEVVEQPTADDIAREDALEFARVKAGVAETILDNADYQRVLKSDKTLARIIKKNPLSLLDEVPVDAEDALNMLEEYLDEQVAELPDPTDPDKKVDEKKKSAKPAPQKTTEATEKKEERKTSDSLSSLETNLKSRVLNEQGV